MNKAEMLALADQIEYAIKTEDYVTLYAKSATLTIDALRTAAASAEPVGYGYSAEIQSAPGRMLHVCRDREALYDTPLYAHPAPISASVREALEEIANHPESKQPTKVDQSSYGVGWAFWNVQRIAQRALADLESEDHRS